ncbi:DUF6777 domain-containing protein [Streptomyces sp. R28]|uniref:DUF6777 domain-containing protein n=1 Tax=Streptomyces sp. R28 TaxID=3238628 RepID=A0AB39PNP6_9ACTN
MSVEPPSSGRPTGPPSGPLSPEPHPPWWKSVPRIAVLTAVVVAAVVLAIVFSRGGGDTSPVASGEVFGQPKDEQGPNPFTRSTAQNTSAAPVTPSPAESAPTNAVRRVNGGEPGLYGGSRNVASCDVDKQIEYFQADPEKNRAFASVADVDPSGVASYLRSLTPVQLRMDTRVTNHGYRDGAATSYQAVLQAGTAVLVDDRGVPRVRCACGNPLTDPVAQQGTFKRTGDFWPSFSNANVVVVSPSTTIVNVFVIFDVERDEWISRQRGHDVEKDKKTRPPARPSPSVSVSTPTSSSSPSKCVPLPDDATEMPPGSGTPCPPTSTGPSSPSSPSTSPQTSTSEPTTTKPETSESPETSASTSQPPSDGSTTATSQSASTASGSESVSGSPSL